MADIVDVPTLSPIDSAAPPREIPRLWSRIALGAILLCSIFMNFFQLGQNGYGNLYYAAAVRSMADSWHNFFFASFDPGGFVTIDKPPLGFWLQTLSTTLFGFTPLSIFLPQAVCGVLAVLLLYYLVRRHFGVVAGLVAALALAVSPISVVTNRNNTIDGTLALILLLAAWAIIHAAETGQLRWLLLSAVFVGVGFNVKMSEAYLVVPALGLTYVLCTPRKIWTRIWHLLLALLVMLVISLSWAAAVDLTPASQRPYIGSTQDNSELSLAIGYNGLNRLHIGGNTSGRNRARAGSSTRNTTRASGAGRNDAFPGPDNASNGAQQFQAAGAAFLGGAPGPWSLFGVSLGGQIAWLFPFALLGLLALAWWRRFNFQKDRQQLGLVLWGFWLLTMAVFFTLDGAFHQYYLTEMAPGLAAMVGSGLVVMWQEYRSTAWRGWLLPIALLVTAAVQIDILASYPSWSRWMSPLIGVLTALGVIALMVLRFRPRINLSAAARHAAGVAVSVGMLALLLAPTIWAGYSVIHDSESSFPTAGPNPQGGFAATGGFGRGQSGLAGLFEGFLGGGPVQTNPVLISYLEAHQGNTKFLVATPSANIADAIILTTNKPVMAMGGFSGSDPILTTSELQTLIKNGTVRFFLINSPRATQDLLDQLPEQFRDLFSGRGSPGGFGGFSGFGQNALSSWVSTHCSAVPSSNWRSATRSAAAGLDGSQLYDCASARS